MPSALRLYLRSSSTWMLVSGRKSRGARLAGRSRLANTRDRMRMETKSPARKGCHSRQVGTQTMPPEPWQRAAPFLGKAAGRGPRRSGQRPSMAACGQNLEIGPPGYGLVVMLVTWESDYRLQAHTPGQEPNTTLEHLTVYKELTYPCACT